MRKIRDVLRLRAAALSVRAIAESLQVSPSTVGDYVRRAEVAGLGWPVPESVDDAALERRLFPTPPPSVVALVKVRFSGRVSTDFLDEVGGVVVKRHSKLTPRRHRILTPKKGRKCIVWMPPQGGLGSFRSGALASRQARAGGPIAPAAEVRAGLRRSPA